MVPRSICLVVALMAGAAAAAAAAAQDTQETTTRSDGRYEVKDSVDVVVPPAPAGFPGWTLTAPDLVPYSNRLDDWLALSAATSGSSGDGALYVDGVPSRTRPLPGAVQRITIDADPFSAEYAEAHRVDITTGAPERRWRVRFGGDLLPLGGRSALASSGGSRAGAIDGDLSGGIPGTPAIFSTQIRDERHNFDQPLTGLTAGNIPTERHGWSRSARLFLPIAGHTDIRIVAAQRGDDITNADAGALVLESAASRSAARSHDVSVSLKRQWPDVTIRSSLVFSGTDASTSANTDALGIRILGALTQGGAASQSARSIDNAWTWKGVAAWPASAAWRAGVVLGRKSLTERESPNPSGVLQFSTFDQYQLAQAGVPGGVWMQQLGAVDVRASSFVGSAFGEHVLMNGPRVSLRLGVRADQQTGDGVNVSPRVTTAVRAGEWTIRAGGGMFTQAWALDVFVPSLASGSGQWEQAIANGVSVMNGTAVPAGAATVVNSSVASDFVRRRDWIGRVSAGRATGRIMPSLEFTYDAGVHLAGSRRIGAASGWQDLLESNRRLRIVELHPSVQFAFTAQRLFVNYEWVVSRDDTAGPFSFPEEQDDLGREWAPSAGVARHSAQVVDMIALPSHWSASVVLTAHSATRYDITSGLDPEGLGLFTDRAGLARNSGTTPAAASLDVFASRRIALPKPVFGLASFTLGIRASNLIAAPDYTSVGSVLSSPLAGRPLGALPGASLRLWLSIA